MRIRRAILATLPLVGLVGTTLADGDHEEARKAYEAGEIVALAKVLDAVESGFTGEVIEVELERDGGRWIYEVELLSSDGSVLELEYDARTVRLETTGEKVDAARKSK